MCQLTGSPLALTSCASTGSGPIIAPVGLGFSNGYAYVSNSVNSTIAVCAASGNTLSACATGGSSNFCLPYGNTLDNSGNCYAANNGNNTVTTCTSSGTPPTLSGCVKSGNYYPQGLLYPWGLALHSSSYLFVSNFYLGFGVSVCTLSNGTPRTLTQCAVAG